jgi:hypothetical protein
MVDKEISYYEKNKRKFRELYDGKYIVIKDHDIIGVYDSHAEAYDTTVPENEIGTFIIKHVVKKH